MKNRLKILFGLLVTFIIAATLVYIFIINQPHRNFEKAVPDFVLTTSKLYSDYSEMDAGAVNKFTGKVLQITGDISNIEKTDSIVVLVFVFNQGMFGDEGVRCTVLPKYHETALKLKAETYVTIKGFCTGYNETDVILEKCSIVNY